MSERSNGLHSDGPDRNRDDDRLGSGGTDRTWLVVLIVLASVVVLLLVFTPLLSLILFSGAFALGFKLTVVAIKLISSAMYRVKDGQ